MEVKRLHKIHRIVVKAIELLIEKRGWNPFLVDVERGKEGRSVFGWLLVVLGRVQQNLAILCQDEYIVSHSTQYNATWYIIELYITGCEKAVFRDEERDRWFRISVNREEFYRAVKKTWK